MTTLRQSIYRCKTFDELRYKAILGRLYGTNADGLPDLSYKIKFGFSGSIDSDVTADVWPLADDLVVLSSSETMDLVSDNVADAPSGVGCDSVFIEGLDSDYLPQSELITLDGTTPVTTTNEFMFIYTMSVLNITSTGTSNVGQILATATSAGTDQASIPPTEGHSQGSHFIVPAGYNALMTDLHVSCQRTSGTGNKRAKVRLLFSPQTAPLSAGIIYETTRLGTASDAGNTVNEFHNPLVVAEKTLFWLTATPEANNTEVDFEYDLILIKTNVDIDAIF